MILPHNYGRYYDKIVNDTAGFEAFWKTLAAPYKSNQYVIFDTNNECMFLFFRSNHMPLSRDFSDFVKITTWTKTW